MNGRFSGVRPLERALPSIPAAAATARVANEYPKELVPHRLLS
jgi:hypothetical protein